MAKKLDPLHDLTFKINTASGNGTSEATHVRTLGGNLIADEEAKNPLGATHQHLAGMTHYVQEKLDSMSLAIISCNWIEFQTLAYQLKQLKPTHDQLNAFFREQIADAVVRNLGVANFDELRRKLKEIGARDKVLDDGYEDGQRRLASLQPKKH